MLMLLARAIRHYGPSGLVSKVTAYQFQRDGQGILQKMTDAGFTKFVITDGYDETSTWNLQPSK
jgi:hypothetical protein